MAQKFCITFKRQTPPIMKHWAQGDGPRSFLLSPKGVTDINAKWLSLSQNLIPAAPALDLASFVKAPMAIPLNKNKANKNTLSALSTQHNTFIYPLHLALLQPLP
jgi:hypothetical protein